jgi:hypothetical protein
VVLVTSEGIDAVDGGWHGVPMTDITNIVNTYIAAWNEGDPDRRRALVAATFADDASYVDPLMAGASPQEIDGLIAGVQGQYPGTTFVLVEGPDHHHDRVRFTWHLRNADDATLAIGQDVATVAPDGRLREVTGFLEIPTAA